MALAGVIAGAIEALVTQPFEVVKTRQQIESKVPKSLVRCIRGTVGANGLGGLYAGLPIMILQSGGKVGIRFGMYDNVKKLFPGNAILAGVVAGSTEAALWITPCERIKVLVIKHREKEKRFSFILRSLYNGGFTSLYRGAAPTICRNGGTVGFRFMLFEKLKPIVGNAALTGALVGAVSTCLNNPIDVIKSAMQAVDAGKRHSHSNEGLGMLGTARNLVQREGLAYMFTAGLKARIFKISIGQAVIFQTVELVKSIQS
mmetsp:Transcript_10078/g.13202  ORF Transcript_10078/g.13202 Transcript_10078/m.13202 type:complete len:259 (-) Transcript_10078:1662-2438(-)